MNAGEHCFLDALGMQLGNLGDNLVDGAAPFFAPRDRDDAERAAVTATVLNLYESALAAEPE
jgi:hypothetical protein